MGQSAVLIYAVIKKVFQTESLPSRWKKNVGLPGLKTPGLFLAYLVIVSSVNKHCKFLTTSLAFLEWGSNSMPSLPTGTLSGFVWGKSIKQHTPNPLRHGSKDVAHVHLSAAYTFLKMKMAKSLSATLLSEQIFLQGLMNGNLLCGVEVLNRNSAPDLLVKPSLMHTKNADFAGQLFRQVAFSGTV